VARAVGLAVGKILANKFESVLMFCTWKSYFLIKKIDFLVEKTGFPQKYPFFSLKNSDFLAFFSMAARFSYSRDHRKILSKRKIEVALKNFGTCSSFSSHKKLPYL
jgi:hypothetical protein